MSTLSVSNITDGTDTVETGYVVNGSAKAWVNFNGTGTVAIRDSLNVSSLTDNGTGDYTINLSNSMANTNFSPVFGWNFTNNVYGGGPFSLKTTSPVTAGSLRAGSHAGNLVAEDNAFLNASISGDLA